MPNSRSKYSESAVSRRKSILRDVLLGVLAALAVVFVVMAGRFIYGKSKDPNYRLANLFGVTTLTDGTLPTMPTFPLESLLPSSSESMTETDGSTEETTEPTEETSEETTPEETSEEVTTEAEGESTEGTEANTSEEDPSGSEEPSSGESETAETTEETTPEETAPEETTPEESTSGTVANDPTDINYHLMRYNMEEDDLGNCRQLIVVSSSGTQCTIYFFDKTDEGWTVSDAIPSAPGVLGRGGVTTDKKEGDGCTPAGYYKLGPCYGEEAASATAMEYHQIVEGDYWVDDASSRYYNTLVHEEQFDNRVGWRTGEDLYGLLRYYRYMVVIQYNTNPIVPGAGSAIFLHCQAGDPDTSGCVSTKEATVFAIFRWLSPSADPHILIY